MEDITNINASNRFIQIENRGVNLKLEGKGVECDSIMCGSCGTEQRNPTHRIKQLVSHRASNSSGSSSSNNNNDHVIMKENKTINFDQFFEIMSSKIREARPTSNIIFESKVSNVSCFLWP